MDDNPTHFDIHEAKTQLSRIVERVERGEEIVLCRAGEPVAKVVSLRHGLRRTARGSLRGKLALADDWDVQEVNDDLAREFGSSDARL